MDISTFLPQIFWLVITFTLLYVVMARSALPKVGRVLEERQNRIDSDLEQAETFRTESEKLEADYERLTAEARAKALAEREKVEAVLSEKQSVMAAQLEARLAEAEARIQKAKDKAYTGVADIAAEACASIVAEVSGQTLTKANAKKAVGSAMGDK